MLLPASFKSTIVDRFYDKDVNVLVKTKTKTNGWETEAGTTIASTFKANVKFDKLGEVQSELGLTEQVHIAMTCLPDVAVKVDDLVSYNGVTYKLSAVIPHDSHLKIAGSKWA